MKYCIGCVHLHYQPGRDGYYYSEYTHDSGEAPELACKKGHWQTKFREEFTQADFEQAMESAETCADFSDRHAQPVQP